MGFPVLKPLHGWVPPTQENSKTYSKLVLRALECEAECAAYREVLKNVMRSGPGERVKIARAGLFGKNTKQRGKTMLKVVKAAVMAMHRMRKGTDKEFVKALAALEGALENFDLRGATVHKWLIERLR
jgi:hypothetical protein